MKQGRLTEDEVRDNVKTLFNVRMRLGEFDPPEMNPYSKLNLSVVQSEAHRNLSVEATLKSFVLLKNDNVLPLKAANYKNVAVGVNWLQFGKEHSIDITVLKHTRGHFLFCHG